MLYELALESFKPFGSRQVARLSHITLLYGPNSGGKSSVIQALTLLRQSMEGQGANVSGLIPHGEFVDLGSYRSLIHRHELSRDLTIELAYDQVMRAPSRVRGVVSSAASRRITLAFQAWKAAGSRKKKDSSNLGSIRWRLNDGQELDVNLRRREQGEETTVPRALQGRSFTWADETSRRSFADYLLRAEKTRGARARGLQDSPVGAPVWSVDDAERAAVEADLSPMRVLATGLIPDRVIPAGDSPLSRPDLQSARLFLSYGRPLEALALEFYDLLRSFSYLGPLRSHPARHYLVTGSSLSVGVRGENTPQLVYRLKDQIVKQIETWFDSLEIPYGMSVKLIGDEVTGEIIALTLKDKRTGVAVAPADVGFGIGQVLPIIVEGVVCRRGIICVEQPEIHLHPRLQAHLADFFVDTAQRGQNQWIIETHSEALMLRLQRRIREGYLKAERISVLYVEPCGKDGSRIQQLRLDDRGEFIDEWPQGFFEERFTEVFGK